MMLASYFWRQIHVLGECRFVCGTREEWYVDVGYCIDRYSLD